jgi:hypothetical protein
MMRMPFSRAARADVRRTSSSWSVGRENPGAQMDVMRTVSNPANRASSSFP